MVESRKWNAKMQKVMYDTGERLGSQLKEDEGFREFVETFPTGKVFARAIGLL